MAGGPPVHTGGYMRTQQGHTGYWFTPGAIIWERQTWETRRMVRQDAWPTLT